MNIRVRNLLLSLLLILLLATPSLAETRYVIDQIVINLRTGKGNEYRTIKTLKTGTAMEILEEDKNYLKVRIKSGEEGYVLKQYVSKKTPGPIVISRLEKEREQLKKEIERLKADNEAQSSLKSSAEDELTEMDKALTLSKQELKLLGDKYEELRFKSEHIVQLADERDQLDAEHSKLSAEVQQLRKENEGFQRSSSIRWFLAGGGVFLFGWIAGKISRKKRREGFYR